MTTKKFILSRTLLASATTAASANAPGGTYIQCDPHNQRPPLGVHRTPGSYLKFPLSAHDECIRRFRAEAEESLPTNVKYGSLPMYRTETSEQVSPDRRRLLAAAGIVQ